MNKPLQNLNDAALRDMLRDVAEVVRGYLEFSREVLIYDLSVPWEEQELAEIRDLNKQAEASFLKIVEAL